MAKMPRALQDSLPCFVTHRCAIDKTFLDYIRSAAPQGVAFESMARTTETQARSCTLFPLFSFSCFVPYAIKLSSSRPTQLEAVLYLQPHLKPLKDATDDCQGPACRRTAPTSAPKQHALGWPHR